VGAVRRVQTEFLIIGGGLAGLAAAHALSCLGDVVVVTKTGPDESNSVAAQGGIAAALDPADSPECHAADTMSCGRGLCDPDAVNLLARRAPGIIRSLIDLGVPFDRQSDGRLALGLEGGHTRRRIAHAGGDATGRAMVTALQRALRTHPRVEREICRHVVWLLKNKRGQVVGALGTASGATEPDTMWLARRGTILATGGAGQLFRRTTNPHGATGDGIALAYQAGAQIRNLEFVQFHPTALAVDGNPCPLISEAVRGAGATLVDEAGRPVMANCPGGDLAPRDEVARAVFTHVQNGGRVFLDATSVRDFAERFPTIERVCRQHGVNPLSQLVPVSPAAHFLMGGVTAAMSGRTAVPGLYALGETACTGVHGANRLASNSLLECLVMAQELARFLQTAGRDGTVDAREVPDVRADQLLQPDPPDILADIRQNMWQAAGIVRHEAGLRTALQALKGLHPRSPAACTATLILQSALSRRESRGAHQRSDFPSASETYARDTVLRRDGSRDVCASIARA
jgi:L-aspartate oxidase